MFKYVSISKQKTLQWVNILIEPNCWNESGEMSPLTYDADELRRRSQPLEFYRLVLLSDTQQAA